jgi:hypothetical protein
MYVGKRIKSVLSVLLIIGLLVVSVPSRAYAAGPIMLVPALSPAMKYAIGAGLVAGGLYAVNKDALNYAISDYWDKASDHIKHQWQNAVIYGTSIGNILLNDSLNRSIANYLNTSYVPGKNSVVTGTDVITDIVLGQTYPTDNCVINDYNIRGYCSVLGPSTLRRVIYVNGEIYSDSTYTDTQYWYKLSHVISTSCAINDLSTMNGSITFYYKIARTDGTTYTHSSTIGLTALLEGASIFYAAVLNHIYMEYVGDTAGFGNATEGRPDIKVPCPPVPAAEWPDTWLDNLQDEMNRTGNPTLDDETFVEECEREWDWYWDDNVAYIYRVPHGDPPREPDDEPIRIPIPPPPQPEIPYPQPDPIPQPADPCPYCPPNPYPSPDGDPCPNPYCPNQPNPVPVPVPQPATPAEPCPYCPPNPYPSPNGEPCPNPYCPNQPNPQPVPKPPPDIQPYYDDPEINWEPLRRSLYELTEKFPFSLPWDLMRGVQSMEANQWDRKIRVVIGDEFWPNFEIDLTMFDRLARISRVIMLVIFDLGLIFSTRKLMGGDV